MKTTTQIQTLDPEQAKLAALEASFAEESQAVVKEGFCAWYVGEQAEIDAADIALDKLFKEQYCLMKKKINNRRNALSFACGDEFKRRIDAMLATMPKHKNGKPMTKSVNFLTGTAGYRKTKESVEFTHLPSAVKWALENMNIEELGWAVRKVDATIEILKFLKEHKDQPEIRETITTLNKTPFMDAIKNSGEVPDGVEMVESKEKFYPEIQHKKLAAEGLPLIGDSDGK